MVAEVRKKRNINAFLLVLAVVLLPTIGSLVWYGITKDASLRPLGVTKETLFGTGVAIVAEVDWHEGNTGGYSKRSFENAITSAFFVKGMEVRVKFHDAAATRVTYVVGDSQIGPFPPSQAAAGVNAAIEAYKMFPTTRRD